jgi:protein involved in polysaccharide export with SLBB domain
MKMTDTKKHFETIFIFWNRSWCLAQAGATVLFLFCGQFSLQAGQSSGPETTVLSAATNGTHDSPSVAMKGFLDSLAPTTATNATHQTPATLLPTPTNGSLTDLATNMEALDDKHTLAISDVLSYRVVEDDEDPRKLIVADSGNLEVPLLGLFPAENLTCKQLAWKIKAALESKYYYQATVIIALDSWAKTRGKVYLVGAVNRTGPVDIPSDEVFTLGKAILMAGGFTDFADRKNVTITRQGGKGESAKVKLVVDVGKIFKQGKTENDVTVNPGDLIYIPERMVRF